MRNTKGMEGEETRQNLLSTADGFSVAWVLEKLGRVNFPVVILLDLSLL